MDKSKYYDKTREELILELESVTNSYNNIIKSTSWRFCTLIRRFASILGLVRLKNFLKQTKPQSTNTRENDIARKNSGQSINIDLESDQIATTLLKLRDDPDALISSDSYEVNLMSRLFFNDKGDSYYSGGAERYILDLKTVCNQLNINLILYQFGSYEWVRFYGNLEVRSLTSSSSFNLDTFQKKFVESTKGHSIVNIYSPFSDTVFKDPTYSVGISHGVWWDADKNRYTSGDQLLRRLDPVVQSNLFCDKIVSVDTNTPNWFQTIDYEMGRKLSYLPNYVDTEQFKPSNTKKHSKRVILYPRRLYAPRGLYLVLEIMDEILEKYDDVIFRFVGKGFEKDTENIVKKIDKWQSRVEWYSLSPDKMYEAYADADISLVPTIHSEGTSLSCLEALASGNAVIATRVGGLCDIVINDHNGLLIEPNYKALKSAISTLLENPDKMEKLKKNARESALSFNKQKWIVQWATIIKDLFDEDKCTSPPKDYKRCRINLQSESIDLDNLTQTVKSLLYDNYYVYISFTDLEENPYKCLSKNRIQLIDTCEDLYFEPEKTINL